MSSLVPKVPKRHPLAGAYEPWVDKGSATALTDKLVRAASVTFVVLAWLTYSALFLSSPWSPVVGVLLLGVSLRVFLGSGGRRSEYAIRERRLLRRHARAALRRLEPGERIHHYAAVFEAPAYGHSRLSGAFASFGIEHREMLAIVTNRRFLVLRPGWLLRPTHLAHVIPKSKMAAVRFEPSRALLGSKNEGLLKSKAAGSYVTVEMHGSASLGLRLTDESEARTLALTLQRLRGGEGVAGPGALALDVGGAEGDGGLSLPTEHGGLSRPDDPE